MLLYPTVSSFEAALSSPSPVPQLILVVINAILEVFFLCVVGWVLAHKGIVDDKAKKTLNKINVSLFTPALLFSKVAYSLTPEKLADLYIIPIGFILVTAFSAGVAWVMGWGLRLSKQQRNFAVACAMFQNSNSLPIALMSSLIEEKMPLAWHARDTKDAMLGRALSYLVLFSTLGIIVRWSIGVKLLAAAENELEESSEEEGDVDDDNERAETEESQRIDETRQGEETPLLAGANGSTTTPDRQHVRVRNGDSHLTVQQRNKGKSRVFQSFPNTPNVSAHASTAGSERGAEDSVDSELEGDEDDEWGVRRGAGREVGAMTKRWRRFKRRSRKTFKPVRRFARWIHSFMTVPLWAALLSIIIACIPPVQKILIRAEPLRSAIRSAGSCSVPITMVVLGAYFYSPATPPTMVGANTRAPPNLLHRLNPMRFGFLGQHDDHKKKNKRRGENKTIFVAVTSRMIIVPLCLLPLFGWWAKLTTNVADDPVFVVTACLLIGSPPAITLAQITSSASGKTFEKLISRTLFVAYAFLTAPTVICLVLAGLLIQRLQEM